MNTILNRGANKTVGVGNRRDQGGVGGGKYVKGEQEQIYPICWGEGAYNIQVAPFENPICKIRQQIPERTVQSKYFTFTRVM